MSTPHPSPRARDLERLLARIARARSILLDIDMWDRWGSDRASPEERARYEADAVKATSDHAEARAALEALVAQTRREAPADVAAWADAHDVFLTAFIAECELAGESAATAAFVAKDERAGWAEVKAGIRPFVDENVYYVTKNPERYRQLFGIDLQTLEDV